MPLKLSPAWFPNQGKTMGPNAEGIHSEAYGSAPCTKGYQKTTKLATGASHGRGRYGDPSDRIRATRDGTIRRIVTYPKVPRMCL
ncbi:uncharacterized protein BDR25DRAFT_356983 [Lindgomyces ingoldianus]|uniref:Uncharacterized protein n=1 Tax=Lindgomyces ingoldianus TaxID=673940 RepID=A0ACB6QRQ4_9PLEO|nr:uncharacterized protein BDR25DRAFT_356983 [Lindgomyces ingoldianus]KAF2469210.1 hypothetical protein BDR25DRAFT_356983 [Lindgomyces ingoldianus]